MTTFATTISRTNLRAWIAGTGATGALIGAALIVFLSAAAFVGFNGLIVGGTNNPAPESVTLANSAAAAPAAAAKAAAPATGAVAPKPARAGGTSGNGSGGGGANGGGGRKDELGTSTGTADGTAGELGSTSSGSQITVAPPTQPAPQGPVSSVTQGVDRSAGTNISQPAAPIATQLDNTVTGLLNGTGSATTGNPQLGDQVGQTVTTVTGPILGGG